MESKPVAEDKGDKLIMQLGENYKIPIADQLPPHDDRLFFLKNTVKPKRKIKELKVDFGKLTKQNVEQFRVLNYMTLPIVYSEDFYNRLTNESRYSSLAYYKDLLVGAVSCRYEDHKDEAGNLTGNKVVYIMSITVLCPYRRYNIGS